ncbi:hypothetical protein BT63DRAFT_228744 [Microthyrium microscopicum]|uniref:Uncharacterized protein n=1 Tax=Microthyrium microscopicum TaxID=703497 RepID=A0A6A6UEZ8_9PEZI|nr:hypothetical protein BT63DRAFT_228744 [Microthyrium microscopicum]
MASQHNDMPIAVVAMNCRFPGDANSPEEFWKHMIEKRDTWTEIPEERFNAKSFYQPTIGTGGSVSFKGAYFLQGDVGKFDPSFFNITESEATAIDPQQRIQLECAYEAFESASIPLRKLRGSKTAVYTSTFNHDYEIMQFRDADNMAHYHSTGNQVVAANRIAYFFDFKGPSMTLDTACSGSSNALHLACQSLKTGEADQALVSGCTLMLEPDAVNGMNRLQFFSKEGRSFAFDCRAGGYGRGEGAACVVLKPLAAALRDGDPIRALVRGTATNQNGRTSTITIPSAPAQVEVALAAYQSCGLDPKETLYVEAHGTGTAAGDPLEIEAIGTIFGDATERSTKTIVGSVKTNIGHLEPVSGLASLIKSILILEKGVIPASLNFEKPNPKAQLERWNVKIPITDEKWQAGLPQRISINNLGVGGSNSHVVIESFPSFLQTLGQQAPSHVRQDVIEAKSGLTGSNTQHRLFVLSAMTEISCKKRIQALKAHCQDQPEENFDSLAYTLSKRYEGFPWRWSVTASSMKDLVAKMEDAAPKLASTASKTGFVFAGQGAQWFAMGRELLGSYPSFQRTMEAADGIYKSLGAEWSLLEELSRDKDTSRVDDAAIGQPLSTALQVALVELLKSWKVEPDCVIGHSSGEIAAAYATGALSLEHALTIAYFRGLHTSRMRQLENAPDGSMMAAGLSVTEAEAEIASLPTDIGSKLVVACVNSPSSVTVSGARQAILQYKDILEQRGVFARALKVDVAYHSSDMQLIADAYLSSIAHCIPSETPSHVEFWSSVRAERISASELQPQYWIENLVSQVKFCQGLGAMSQQTTNLGMLIEVSPHSVFEGPIKQTLGPERAVPYASMLKRNFNAAETALQAAQKMLESGVSVDVECTTYPLVDEQTTHLLTDLPQYCWDHSNRYWHESAVTTRHLRRAFPYHELLGSRVPQSTSLEPQWRNILKISALDWLSDHRVNDNIIFPGAGYLCIAMQAFYQNYSEKNFRPEQPKFLELRDIVFERGLLLDDPSMEVEIVCYLRPVLEQLREASDTRYEFRVVSSSDATTWHKHCRGTIVAIPQADQGELPQTGLTDASARPLDRKEAYQKFQQVGLNYGPNFRTIVDGFIDDTVFDGHVKQMVDENGTHNHNSYIVHPATLDGIFQAMVAPNVYNRNASTAMVPTSMDSLTISCGTTTDAELLHVHATSRFLGKTNLNAYATVTKSDGLAIRIDNFAAVVLEGELAIESSEDHGCYRMEWIQDPSMFDTKQIQDFCLKSTPNSIPCPTNPLYVQAALHFYREAVSQVPLEEVKVDYLRHLHDYMRSVLASTPEPAEAFDLSKLQETSTEATMLRRMGIALPGILRGEVDPLSLMLEDNLLYKYYAGDWIDHYYEQMAAYVNLLAKKKPTMKILEIGAGTGGTTMAILNSMPADHGFSYTFTDISAGFFIQAREVLSKWNDSIIYKKLDIESDPVEQGFEAGDYDLIIASNVLHATKYIETTLSNTGKLLRPGGQLLLLEVTRPTRYLHLVFGCLAGWWLGSEDYTVKRTEGPCLSGESWIKTLGNVGFGSSICVPDAASEIDSSMSVIVATMPHEPLPASTTSFVIVPDVEYNLIKPQELQRAVRENLSSPCEIIDWATELSPDQVCIFVGASTSSLLIAGNEDRFKQFQKMISASSGAVVLTSGAIGDSGVPTQAVLTGLSRNIRSETDSMKFITVDIESQLDVSPLSSILAKSFLGESNETEFAIRENTVQVPRVIPETTFTKYLNTGDVEETGPIAESSVAAVKLDFRTLGFLESLRFVPDDLIKGPLNPDQIQVEVKAAGVNFRHVLYALGKFSAAEYAERPAGECSGVVTAVGDNVKDQFQVGDRVVSSGIFNAFTTAVRIPAISTRRIPDSMSFVEAAQFPLTYLTSWYSLVNLAHIRKGDNVLIHSGTGAVGQSAITIAQHFGANVFATCGNDEKKQFLVDKFGIPEENIFSSKNYRFVDGIMNITNGKGIDIILNSLSGEFITESCRCLGTFGRFIEIGKNDILSGSKLNMAIFNKSTSFIALDLSRVYELEPETIGTMLQKVIDMLQDGSLKWAGPLHVRNFGDCPDAFRYMSTGKHIGKMVLDLSTQADLKVTIPDFAEKPIRGSATYLISGGLGGLGREICRWMATHDDTVNLVAFSRSKTPSKAAQSLTAELLKHGAILTIMTCDVGNEDQVREAIEECRKTLPPIRGVVQGAMVLRDCPFETMTKDQFHEVVVPKVQGTQNLVKYLPPCTLDFFIILSSVVGIIGGPTQGNYVAASTFQDSYARYLTSMGQPVTSLDLGWMKGAGYVEENKFASDYVASQGMQPVSMDTFFRALSYAIKRKPENASQSQLMIGLSHTMKERLTRVGRFSFLRVRQSVSAGVTAAGPTQTRSAQQVIQSCKSYNEATTFIGQKLLEKIASLMAIQLSSLKLEASVSDYGIDSLIAIEIRNWMRQELGCNLGTFEILGSKTIAALGELAAQRSRWLAEAEFQDGPGAKAEEASSTDSDTGSVISDSTPTTVSLNSTNIKSDLPSLPVPTLDVTTSALLKSLRLISSDEEYLRSKACVENFIAPTGVGHKLQARLMDYTNTTKNWHSDLWMDRQYFDNRAPIAPFTNYFGVHEPSTIQTMSEAASYICAAVLNFQEEVENGTMERDLLRDAQADMQQYKNMFNACRIPGKPKDYLVRFDAASHRHITVIRGGHFFKLNYEYKGQRLDQSQLKAALEAIIEKDLGSTLEVGAFTTMNRDDWADARIKLMESSPEAGQSLEDVQSSCFILCLDNETPKTLEEEAAQVWYGKGLNRFFDKPVQFTVNDNGHTGYIGEHSASDGGPSLRLNDYVQEFIRKAKNQPIRNTAGLEAYRLQVDSLQFPATTELSEIVTKARAQFDKTISTEDMVSISCEGFGDIALSSKKTNSNTFVQVVLNLAAYRMYGELKPNYEPVALTSFNDGRWTSCSMVIEEVLKFCQLADDPTADQAARKAAFDAALIAHGKNVTTAADGTENTEAHLLALKEMIRDGEEAPELFKDPLHQKSQQWYLSASFLPSKHSHSYGFWQVVEDGMGIGNMIRPDKLQFLIVGANGGCKDYATHIQHAARDVGKIIGVVA